MQYSLARTTSTVMLSAALLFGCGADNDAGAPIGVGNGHQFELSDVGMRGMSWNGEASLLESGLEFPEVNMEMSRQLFSLATAPRDMSEFNDPSFEFRGSPVGMALHIRGLVEEAEPGRVTVAIESVRPDFGSLGTSVDEEMRENIATHGITIPEANQDNPIMVTLLVSAADEDNREISVTSDSPLIGNLVMRGGERSPL